MAFRLDTRTAPLYKGWRSERLQACREGQSQFVPGRKPERPSPTLAGIWEGFFMFADVLKGKEYHKQWYLENKARVLALQKLRLQNMTGEQREALRQWHRDWGKKNRKKCLAYVRKYVKNNRQKVLECNRRYHAAHKAEEAVKWQEYYRKHSQERKESRMTYNMKYKMQVLRKYGGKCAGCGETDIAALTIDHVNNDGGKLRRAKQDSHGNKFIRQLLKTPKRDDLQVLCNSCQLRKRSYGKDMSQWKAKAVHITEQPRAYSLSEYIAAYGEQSGDG